MKRIVFLLALSMLWRASLSASNYSTKAYLIPGFIEEIYDTNAQTSWQQYIPIAKRPDPAWRVFNSEEDTIEAIKKHQNFKFSAGNPIADMIITLQDDFHNDKIPLRRNLREKALTKVTPIGLYFLHAYRPG